MAGRYIIGLGCLLCLLPGSVVGWLDYTPSWAASKFRASLEADAKLLAPPLREIEDELMKLPLGATVDDLLQELERLYNKKGLLKCFRGENKKKPVLEKLTSLKSLTGQCDQNTLVVFETIRLASEQASSSERLLRIEQIVYHYRSKHVDACMPVYKGNYDTQLKRLESDPEKSRLLEQVHLILDKLDHRDFAGAIHVFDCLSPACRLIMQPDIKLEDSAMKAIFKITQQIGKQVKKTLKPDSIKNLAADDEKLGEIFDERLNKPCEQFRKMLAPVLEPGLILATTANNQQFSFLTKNADYFRALFDYALCGLLLDERNKVKHLMSREWRDNFHFIIGKLGN